MSSKAAARGVLGVLASLVLVAVGPGLAMGWLEADDLGPGSRAGAVAFGVGSLLPMLGVVARLTARSDEYQREGVYQMTALAFGLSVVVLALADFLALGGFVDWGTFPPAWQMLLLLWGLSALVVRARRGREG